MRKPSAATVGWLAAYIGAMAALLWLLFLARASVIESLSGPQAQADWQAWKDQQTQQQDDPDQPVKRRAPKSDEPPGLVLMRDYFHVVATLAILVGTIFFGITALVVKGLMGERQKEKGERQKEKGERE